MGTPVTELSRALDTLRAKVPDPSSAAEPAEGCRPRSLTAWTQKRLLTQRRQEARTQRSGRRQRTHGLESLAPGVKLTSNRNPCVLAPLRLCVAASAFFGLNGAMSRALASSQRTQACGLASRSRKRCSMATSERATVPRSLGSVSAADWAQVKERLTQLCDEILGG